MGEGQGVGGDEDGTDPIVGIHEVARSFGSVAALKGVSLDVARGEFVSILGPSGCGKTTLLRIVGGFEHADAGRVLIEGRDVTRDPPNKRPVNMVFQRYALFPHKSVAENIGFGLALRRRPRAEIRRKVDEMLGLVHLEGYGERRTTELSGGQAQRVALARALANDPAVLLLDEPLAALDLKLRQAMHFELRRIQREVGSTFVYVTHDQEEALTMSDRIVLMNHGAIEQIGSPLEVYRAPKTRFVSGFIGEANMFAGTVLGCTQASGLYETTVQTGSGNVVVRGSLSVSPGREAWVSVRPEAMRLHAASSDAVAGNVVAGQVEGAVFLGPSVRYLVSRQGGTPILVQTDAVEGPVFAVGDPVRVVWAPEGGTLICD